MAPVDFDGGHYPKVTDHFGKVAPYESWMLSRRTVLAPRTHGRASWEPGRPPMTNPSGTTGIPGLPID